MNRTLTDDQINELTSHLQGSCESLDNALNDLFNLEEANLTVEDCHEIDNLIFLCEVCGWWFELSEESNTDQTCVFCVDSPSVYEEE